jgi:hypothetical protein
MNPPLNALEVAVWASAYVRVLTAFHAPNAALEAPHVIELLERPTPNHVFVASRAADSAVDALRRVVDTNSLLGSDRADR